MLLMDAVKSVEPGGIISQLQGQEMAANLPLLLVVLPRRPRHHDSVRICLD